MMNGISRIFSRTILRPVAMICARTSVVTDPMSKPKAIESQSLAGVLAALSL
jgi:hypothetical protein